ncbi:Hypothetical protein PACV_396 [Pacmanvirus A23]|uniref:Hypothetical protein n=1 Tax=Pacmanvirus A23 TaxID=1932881 RepID=UPI000A09206F|nr:Hypothetical protein B9W72_gp392 [Pacmanvirus A23]SIP86109.1 Hypothetical protein PACV_396 [Pacmanvirus A23]
MGNDEPSVQDLLDGLSVEEIKALLNLAKAKAVKEKKRQDIENKARHLALEKKVAALDAKITKLQKELVQYDSRIKCSDNEITKVAEMPLKISELKYQVYKLSEKRSKLYKRSENIPDYKKYSQALEQRDKLLKQKGKYIKQKEVYEKVLSEKQATYDSCDDCRVKDFFKECQEVYNVNKKYQEAFKKYCDHKDYKIECKTCKNVHFYIVTARPKCNKLDELEKKYKDITNEKWYKSDINTREWTHPYKKEPIATELMAAICRLEDTITSQQKNEAEIVDFDNKFHGQSGYTELQEIQTQIKEINDKIGTVSTESNNLKEKYKRLREYELEFTINTYILAQLKAKLKSINAKREELIAQIEALNTEANE